MPYTEFCCRAGGNNLNAGTRNGSAIEPGIVAEFTYTGTFNTNTFTLTPGNPPVATGSISVGDFCHVSDDSLIGRLAQITSITTGTIVLSSTRTGTVNTGTYTRARIGGAWLGPTGANAFPFSATNLYAVANFPLRVNFKNDQVYYPTSTWTINGNTSTTFEGYTSSYGDNGKSIIDGNNTSMVLLTNSATNANVKNFQFQNNGATGTTAGVTLGGNGRLENCSFYNIRGSAVTASNGFVEDCDATNCNLSNTASVGIFNGGAALFKRCIAYFNIAGSNCHGFYITSSIGKIQNCISFGNSGNGIMVAAFGCAHISNTDVYANLGDGLNAVRQGSYVEVENSNFLANLQYGVRAWNLTSTPASTIVLNNCGFGSGTEMNSNGTTTGVGAVFNNCFHYPANVRPWGKLIYGDLTSDHWMAKSYARTRFPSPTGLFSNMSLYTDIGAVQGKTSTSRLGGGGLVR